MSRPDADTATCYPGSILSQNERSPPVESMGLGITSSPCFWKTVQHIWNVNLVLFQYDSDFSRVGLHGKQNDFRSNSYTRGNHMRPVFCTFVSAMKFEYVSTEDFRCVSLQRK